MQKVTVDKSHIITIGERLYAESIECIRELVNNAYDADAVCVDVKLTGDTVEVHDNGTGMDREGLRRYDSTVIRFCREAFPVTEYLCWTGPLLVL